ncbi:MULTISPECIES: monovalent cation/H(+) antiporter subunit G [unclassified Variovorax]|uniref:monovalent cation/H(+) antiporter subunit G n=1 Tax=unclassified Variovorax TaxID=663243 RepID=UPI001BD4777B|nr:MULTISPECIES: monovalent cation/H(+) antiporter subunit G [unclassified Variovorax]
MNSTDALPLWAEVLTAVFAVLGAAFAAIGSFGLVRLPTFFRRIHAPTLGATFGVWCITLATGVYFSVQGLHLFLHAGLISLFVAMTAPITTIFLMRAALFRARKADRASAEAAPTEGLEASEAAASDGARPGVDQRNAPFK